MSLMLYLSVSSTSSPMLLLGSHSFVFHTLVWEHFELILKTSVESVSRSLSCTWVPSCFRITAAENVFAPLCCFRSFVKRHLATSTRTYSAPLTYCLFFRQYHTTCFIVNLEVTVHQSSKFALLLQRCVGSSGSFASPWKLRNQFVSIYKIICWDWVFFWIEVWRADILLHCLPTRVMERPSTYHFFDFVRQRFAVSLIWLFCVFQA